MGLISDDEMDYIIEQIIEDNDDEYPIFNHGYTKNEILSFALIRDINLIYNRTLVDYWMLYEDLLVQWCLKQPGVNVIKWYNEPDEEKLRALLAVTERIYNEINHINKQYKDLWNLEIILPEENDKITEISLENIKKRHYESLLRPFYRQLIEMFFSYSSCKKCK